MGPVEKSAGPFLFGVIGYCAVDGRVYTTLMTTTFIGKCLKCKVGARFEAETTHRLGYGNPNSRHWMPPWGWRAEQCGDGSIGVSCLCGGWARFYPLIARVTDHRCDRRCTGAKGHVCECQCGGANHGTGLR